jgi:Legume-like lectin family
MLRRRSSLQLLTLLAVAAAPAAAYNADTMQNAVADTMQHAAAPAAACTADTVQQYFDEEVMEKQQQTAGLVDAVSIEAPFHSLSKESGARSLPAWEVSGSTVVKRNFLRLTPDAKYATGAAWSEQTINSADFSMELKFRASGKDEQTHGESFSLFVAESLKQPLGTADFFKGLQVVIDHTGHPAAERVHNVKLLINDGTTTAAALLAGAPGCTASMRYWEGRDDFSVLNASRLRLQFSASSGTLSLQLDARNTGLWKDCVTLVALPADFAVRSKVGLLASNGAAGNNHDVIAVKIFKSAEAAWELEHYSGSVESVPDALAHHLEVSALLSAHFVINLLCCA